LGAVYRGRLLAVVVIVVIGFCSCFVVRAQSSMSFSPSDRFSIPVSDGSISFAVNGSYSGAVLENDTWVFTDLQLKGSLLLHTFRFSAENCNVVIVSYRFSAGAATQSVRLSYVVEGLGNQIVNFGVSSQGGSFGSAAWNVGVGSNRFESVGNGWKLLSDGTVVVLGSTGNVTVTHYFFLSGLASNSRLPFYVQHSVGLAVVIILVVTVLLAFVIKIRKSPVQVKDKEFEIS